MWDERWGQLLFRIENKAKMSIKIRNRDSQTRILREKAIMEKGRAKKQSQKLWEKMSLNLNQNKMLRINSKNMTIKL